MLNKIKLKNCVNFFHTCDHNFSANNQCLLLHNLAYNLFIFISLFMGNKNRISNKRRFIIWQHTDVPFSSCSYVWIVIIIVIFNITATVGGWVAVIRF